MSRDFPSQVSVATPDKDLLLTVTDIVASDSPSKSLSTAESVYYLYQDG